MGFSAWSRNSFRSDEYLSSFGVFSRRLVTPLLGVGWNDIGGGLDATVVVVCMRLSAGCCGALGCWEARRVFLRFDAYLVSLSTSCFVLTSIYSFLWPLGTSSLTTQLFVETLRFFSTVAYLRTSLSFSGKHSFIWIYLLFDLLVIP